MTDKKSNESRRKLLKSIAAGSGAVIAGKSLPENWTRPVVDSVMLPAHAQTSCRDVTRNETIGIIIEIIDDTVTITINDPTGDAGGPIESVIPDIPFDGTSFLLEFDDADGDCTESGFINGTLVQGDIDTFSGSAAFTTTCTSGESCETTADYATTIRPTDFTYAGTGSLTEICCIITGDIL
jgi:hypothetical protein